MYGNVPDDWKLPQSSTKVNTSGTATVLITNKQVIYSYLPIYVLTSHD